MAAGKPLFRAKSCHIGTVLKRPGPVPDGTAIRRRHNVNLAAMTKQYGSNGARRRWLFGPAATLAVAALAGCGTGGDMASTILVAPGQYVLFQCADIDRVAKATVTRQKELDALMAKAGTSTTGQLIGEATYGPELATLRGRMRNLRAAARDKNCNFVPGEEPPAAPPPPPAAKPKAR